MIPVLALLQWGKIIALAALVAALVLYVGNAERNRGLVRLLEADIAVHIGITERQTRQIASLNEQIDRANARALEQLAAERARLIKARAEAERIRIQRDTVTAELAASRQDWQEAVAHDPDLADFIAHPVPAAVWGRLRRAAGG